MKDYSLGMQYGDDIIWYFLGADNTIAAFASGGAILPDIIAKNAADNEMLNSYFDK